MTIWKSVPAFARTALPLPPQPQLPMIDVTLAKPDETSGFECSTVLTFSVLVRAQLLLFLHDLLPTLIMDGDGAEEGGDV